MTTLLCPLLAAMVFSQAANDQTTAGEVVDDQGKPVADVPVVFYVPPAVSGKEYQADAQTRTDAGGQFRMKLPPLGRMYITGINFLAYRPDSAITARALFSTGPYRLVLRKPEPRTIQVVGPDGQPIVGVRIAPLILHVFNGDTAEIPESMAGPLAITTGPDGRATVNYLAARDQLVAVRVSAEPIGSQDFLLVERPGRSAVEPIMTIRLKKTSRLAGRIVDRAGQPVAGQAIEIWSKGGGRLRPNSVELRGGPLKTGANGQFQTPDNLMVGSTYRVVVRGPGKEPILSDWIAIDEAPRALLPMRLRSLRTIGGRVVDRQGKPVANVEVFQSGDGPEQTSTQTGPDGRFLGGFRQGPVCVFARVEGFRFHGQLIKEDESEVAFELTRSPSRRRGRCGCCRSRSRGRNRARWCGGWPSRYGRWSSRRGTIVPRPRPCGSSSTPISRESWRSWNRRSSRAPSGNPGPEPARRRAGRYRPGRSHLDRRVDLRPLLRRGLDRPGRSPPGRAAPPSSPCSIAPALHARAVPDAADRLQRFGEAADQFHELGEVEKARSLFAEGLRLANQMTDKKERQRAYFAARLAVVNAPEPWASPRSSGASASEEHTDSSWVFR